MTFKYEIKLTERIRMDRDDAEWGKLTDSNTFYRSEHVAQWLADRYCSPIIENLNVALKGDRLVFNYIEQYDDTRAEKIDEVEIIYHEIEHAPRLDLLSYRTYLTDLMEELDV